jgi:hypothetical protein
MSRTSRVAATFAAAAAATLFTAVPAFAKSTPPPPTGGDTPTFCPAGTEPGTQQPDGSIIFGVEANGAGCVVVRTIPQGIGLDHIVLAPGWTAVFKGSHALSGKVEIEFDQTGTRNQVEVRIEPGKTEVKSS